MIRKLTLLILWKTKIRYAKKQQSCVTEFTTWLEMAPRNETREINTMQTEELDNDIGLFLLSIRKADVEQYEPDTQTSYHRGIDGYLREKRTHSRVVSKTKNCKSL